jgi:hypothetical protein
VAKANKSAGGIGESKQFGAGDQFETPPAAHVNGREVGLGPLDHLLAGTLSDEAIAEREKLPKARVQVLREPLDKAFEERRDFRENESEPWMAPDPMGDIAKEHCPVGHKPRFLSDNTVTRRGMRGWKPVIGTDGQPVKVGNMTLASMPIERAEKRNEFYRRKGDEKLAEIYNTQVEQISRTGLKVTTNTRGNIGLQRSQGDAKLEL